MAKQAQFVSRFKYTILAVLTVVTLAYGYYLYRVYWPAEPAASPPPIPVAVMVDGTVRVDGATYASPAALKRKVTEMQQSHPGAAFSISAPHGGNFEPIAKAVALLQQSGAKTIEVVNEPPPTPDKTR
jgi:biopolymer transport protein ExbD